MQGRRKNYFYKRIIAAVIAAVVLITAVTVTAIAVPKSARVEYDVIYDGIDGQGFIIRDESCTDLSEYEKLYFENILDGEYIEAGTPVVRAFKKGYIKATLQKLGETEKSIVAYQNQSVISDYDDRTVEKFDFDIEVAIRRMSEDKSGYIELYSTLCTLMREREEYIKETYNTDSNTYLQELYADEKDMTDSLNAWCDVFSAEANGYCGFFCDGLEELNGDSAMNLNMASLKEYKSSAKSNINAFKTVKSDRWYIAVTAGKSADFTEGLYYPVFIGNEPEHEVGCLEKIIDDKKGDILIFSFEKNVQNYIDMRVTDVFIGKRTEGFTVPSKYVKNNAVTVRTATGKTSIPVDVISADSKKTLIAITDSLSVGMKVYSK